MVPGGDRKIDIPVLEQELDQLLFRVQRGSLWDSPPFNTAAPALRVVRDIAIAGDGEPTAAPEFVDAIASVGHVARRRGLRLGLSGDVSLHLLTNATLLHRPRVAEGLEAFAALGGELWAKLDAGSQTYFELVDGTSLPLDRVVQNIVGAAQRRPLVLQCMFMRWEGHGPDDVEISAWTERLVQILEAGGEIRLVQVYTLARRPADPRASVLPLLELERIAQSARNIGLAVELSPGACWES
jgi:wyosine [tRNA(Phe)-imidazoG37] synthetase (radical SAM superfamily)